MAPALAGTLYANMVRNRNFNNELMQVTVDMGDAEGRVFRYDIRRNLADYTWNTWYLQLTNLRDINTIASKPESLNRSYQGISRITDAWVSQLLTDVYGDVPYFDANKGKDGVLEPAFDKQKDIYLDLLKKLEEYTKKYPQEKVYLHLDKPFYAIGDDIWFKAYVLNSKTAAPSTISNILYVELINERDSIKKQIRFKLIFRVFSKPRTIQQGFPPAGRSHSRWSG